MAMTPEQAHSVLSAPGAPFELEECVVRGVKLRCWKHTAGTIRTLLLRGRAYGAREYLVYEDERYSYEQSFVRTAALARHLVEELGIRKGDRVALAMRNYPEWVFSFWAITSIGAVVVPLNAWWRGEELAYALRDSNARVLIADLERYARVSGLLTSTAVERVVVARAADALPKGCIALEARLRFEGAPPSLPEVELAPDDEATIFYTSGTTGDPKGAVGTHRNLVTSTASVAYVRARAALIKDMPLSATSLAPNAQTVMLLSVPLFHVMGCHSGLAYNTAYGGKLVMMHKWDPERALELIERERVTNFGGAPGMAFQVLEAKGFARRDTSSVTGINLGGAPAAPDLVRRVKQAFPASSASNGYGLTETSALSVSNAGIEYERKPDSIGLPVPVCDVKAVGEDGRELARGEIGELWIRGPNVVSGYFGNPAATAQSFIDGWLRTGDLVRIDADGYVFVLDRQKDMLIRGGENVYCVEVENVLYQHPDVVDAAVVGLPHPVLGEEVAAVVQRKADSTLNADALRAYAAERLAAFKLPTRVAFRTEPLPRNPNGKILKQQLKRELQDSSS